ncbi:unnamed protein product [Phytomonas sp. EM1]|nr:unnamed protein product [Phytomonas sp. EM1]|eukprot:CCW65723.1 unnamed protein product [Phytomonas sp. isolate EM1]
MSTSVATCIDKSLWRLSRSDFNELVNQFRTGRYAWVVREKVKALEGLVTWLEGNHRLMQPNRSEVLVHLYVVYNASYSLPQLCFSPASWDDFPHIHEFLPRLLFTNIAEQNSLHDSGSERPLVSYTYVDDLQTMVYTVHPCDTSGLMTCGNLDGLKGNALRIFLQVMAPFISLPTVFIPDDVAL